MAAFMVTGSAHPHTLAQKDTARIEMQAHFPAFSDPM